MTPTEELVAGMESMKKADQGILLKEVFFLEMLTLSNGVLTLKCGS